MENTIKEVEVSKGKNKGFTLIELLIVIVILGVLATVTVLAVRGISDRGKTSACDADKKTLQTAAEAYYAQNGAYPADMTAMVSGGFLQGASVKYTYAHVAAAAGPPATPEGYTLASVAGSGCT